MNDERRARLYKISNQHRQENEVAVFVLLASLSFLAVRIPARGSLLMRGIHAHRWSVKAAPDEGSPAILWSRAKSNDSTIRRG
jgi:hypothetical protein